MSHAPEAPTPVPLRVLQYSYGGDHLSGIDSYLIESYRTIDRERVQFDFLYRYGCPLGDRAEELRALGARIFSLGVPEHQHVAIRQLKELVRLWRFLRNRRYDVVEINMTALFMCLQTALVARLFGTRVRIVHAHDAVKHEHPRKRLLKRAFAPALDAAATDFWACSADAARYLFTARRVRRSDWVLVNNGIDTARFRFDPVSRADKRAELGLRDDELCVGMVGRLTDQKNHLFGLEVFGAALRGSQMRLVVAGDGPLLGEARASAEALRIEKQVTFLGSRRDIPELMCAFDVLLAPSLHEGFPLVALEAQATGLALIVSDAFPAECDLTGRVTFLPLDAPIETWSDALRHGAPNPRADASCDVHEAGFDRRSTAEHLERLYARVGASRSGR